MRTPSLGALRRFAPALVLAGVSSAWTPSAWALDPSWAVTQYRRESWNTKEGLPQSSVESIAQTPDGYLWLGTQEGLARFDGLRFSVFDKANTRALRHNRVTALFADKAGRLFVGTEGGGVARVRDGQWAVIGTADGLPNPRVRAFTEDGAGRVYAATDGGLAVLEDGAATQVRDARLQGVMVAALFAGPSGVWVGTRAGIVLLRDGRVEESGVPGLPSGGVEAVWEDRDKTLWMGTTRGLFVREKGAPAARPAPFRGTTRPITALRRDRDGNLWVGTEMAGLVRIGPGGEASFGTKQGLSNDQVLELFEDREGSLWVGTQDGGANRLGMGKVVTFSKTEGLAGDIVWPVLGDREGNVWIGTKTGGLSRFKEGAFETFSTRRGLSDDAVQALAQGKDGSLWIGTRAHGLNRLQGGRFRVYTTRDGLPSDSVSALAASRDGSLWIGTRGGGLSRMDGESFTVWGPKGGFPETVHNILEARDGTVWIATNGGGLVRFRGGRWKTYTTKDGLSADIVNVVHEDAAGTLWVGTFGGGLNRMTGERFSAYTTSEGLYDDAIFSILEDGQERLWMSCNKGIFRVDKREIALLDKKAIPRLNPVVFGVEDGMKNRECNGANQPPASEDAEGRFWFPTIEGVVRVDPKHLPDNPAPPRVLLEQVLVDGRPTSPVAGLVLPAGRRNIEFHYAAPSFVSPGRVRYRYKLEGLDADWVDAGARRDAYYSRLPAGEFTFRVAAVNGDGVPSPAETAFSFRLEPRLVERPWFFGLLAVALGGVMWVGDRLRVRGVKARERELQLLVEERTRELAEANARLERLSALDGLTGVANRRRFDEALDLEWRRAARAAAPLSLIMLDLDFFKAYNDTNGHLAGDEMLRQVAQALVSAVGRAGDLVARYGGEEFVVLLPGMPEGEAAALAERLRTGVESLGLGHNASPVSRVVTLTAGVATLVPGEKGSPAALLAAADGALYRAKREGRNRVAAGAS